ncbi:hypothetical protein [Deinococcus frigens]|uniref:hypothetical protein n=1 Tax=Deinococcus frigens TaxID=249403 RepID=UPI000B21572B|nr:hypothetical protein [Deinococcus frigens]
MTIPSALATPLDLDAGTTSATRWRYAGMGFGLVIPAQVSSFFFLYYVDHLKDRLKVDPVKFAALMGPDWHWN